MLKKLKGQRLSRKGQFLLLSLMPIYFIIAGLFVQPLNTLLPGMWRLIVEPDFLITDYFVVGGVGAAFLNAGLLTLASIAIVYAMGLEMDGHTITSAFLMFGFSLFGKNLLNIWAILAGIWLYAHYHKTSAGRYIYVGLYGTSLSPVITQVLHLEFIPGVLRILLGIAMGVMIGFVLPPLATHVHYAHKGYSLYNVGFAGGIIATVIVSLFRSFGIIIESRSIWYTGGNLMFDVLLKILFLAMILIPLMIDGKGVWAAYRRILKTSGVSGTDYLKSEGGLAAIFNMGINGMFASVFMLVVGGDLNGPTIGGIMTIVGFSVTGKHIRNIFPVMFGVYFASLVKIWNITDPSAMLALLFSTTLAPVAGEFGMLAGMIAGFLHSSVVINVGSVYAGMNLYNNGFAGGIVAIFMVPVVQSIRDRRARARGGLSL